MVDETLEPKYRQRWRDRATSLLLSTAVALVVYFLSGGKFSAQEGRQAVWALGMMVLLGFPLFCLFRVVIRWLAFWTRAKGYWATAIGIAVTLCLVVGLAYLIPKNIGMGCLPLGLVGGMFGALEAKDRSLVHKAKVEPRPAP